MNAVTRPEFELLSVARAVVGAVSLPEVERFLIPPLTAPARIGPTAARLLQQILSQGAVLSMVQGGGWRTLGGTQRLWERRPAPALDFSRASVSLLEWLLKTLRLDRMTAADEWLLATAFSRLQGSSFEGAVASQKPVQASAACWLWAPVSLGRIEPPKTLPKFELGAEGALAWALDGWQHSLAASWAAQEHLKSSFSVPSQLSQAARAQEAVLTAVLDGCEKAGRREWSEFLLDATRQLLANGLQADDLVGGLDPRSPIRERSEARKASGALLRALRRLRTWDAEHRSTRFIDEGYQKAQAMVQGWERFGDAGFREAERLLGQLETVF